MSPRELLYFTARCLTFDDYPEYREQVTAAFSAEKDFPDIFIKFCDRHLILPAVYIAFKKHNLLYIFTDEYKEHLAALYLRNKKRNLEVLRQIEEINQVLHKKQITPVYLKGTAHLLNNLYSDPGERLIGDIDVLVKEKDYLKSAELIMQLGYRHEDRYFGDVTTYKHFPRLFRIDVPNDIEIHRIAVDKRFSKHFSAETIFQQKKEIIGKTNCFVPSNTHQVIHNFIHCQMGNLGYRFKTVSLRDLYDLHLLAKKTDLRTVVQQTNEIQKITVYHTLAAGIFQNKSFTDSGINKPTQRYIKKFNWFLNHPQTHKFYILYIKITELLFIRFFSGLAALFTTPHSFHTIFQAVSNPVWYKMLLFRVRNFYNNYISRR